MIRADNITTSKKEFLMFIGLSIFRKTLSTPELTVLDNHRIASFADLKEVIMSLMATNSWSREQNRQRRESHHRAVSALTARDSGTEHMSAK